MTNLQCEISYSDAIDIAIKEEMERDESVVFIAEDIAIFADSGVYGDIDRGRIRSAPISENSFSAIMINIQTGNNVGGLIGQVENSNCIITDSYTTGDVIAASNSFYAGGLIGSVDNSGTFIVEIKQSFASGTIIAANNAGGFIGKNSGILSILESYYKTGSVLITEYHGGGFVGSITASGVITIIDSYVDATVSGESYIGGMIGKNAATAIITNSYTAGTVHGSYLGSGGLVALNDEATADLTISGCRSQTSISGQGVAGGLVGLNSLGR